MPDTDLTNHPPPALVRASAFTPAQLAQLGIPRGLVAYRPPSERAADVQTLEAAAAVETPTPGVTPTAPAMGLGPRTRYRFQAHNTDSPVVPPSNLTSDPATSRRAGAVRKPRNLSALARAASLVLVGALAAGAGYYVALPISDETAAQGGVERRDWTRGDRRKLDAIFAAERAAKPREMRELVNQLAAARPGLTQLDLLRARAAVAESSFAEAEVDMNKASREPQADQAAVSMARSTNFARQRRLPDLLASLTDAIQQDPTRAEFYFELAETDRRMGRTSDALANYAQARALARPGRVPSPETIEFQRRLLLIESGRESEIDTTAYRAALAKDSPPPDWMLIAAAVALQRDDAATAVHWMRTARRAMPWTQYVTRVDDYAFRNHINQPGLREVLPTASERKRAQALLTPMLVDP